MKGMVEASIQSGSGSSDFIAYNCTASRLDSEQQQLKLTFQRLFGEIESRAFTIPQSRHVYLTVHSEGGALIVIESGPVRITIRALARNIDDWLAVLSGESEDDDEVYDDVFETSTEMRLPEHAKSRFLSITSSSSATDYLNNPNLRYFAANSVSASNYYKQRHCSLGTGLDSTKSACTPGFFLRRASSYPDEALFHDDGASIDVSEVPSDDGDQVTEL